MLVFLEEKNLHSELRLFKNAMSLDHPFKNIDMVGGAFMHCVFRFWFLAQIFDYSPDNVIVKHLWSECYANIVFLHLWVVNKELVNQWAWQKRIGLDFLSQSGGPRKRERGIERGREERCGRPCGWTRKIRHEITMREQPQHHTWTRASHGKTKWQVMGHWLGVSSLAGLE